MTHSAKYSLFSFTILWERTKKNNNYAALSEYVLKCILNTSWKLIKFWSFGQLNITATHFNFVQFVHVGNGKGVCYF